MYTYKYQPSQFVYILYGKSFIIFIYIKLKKGLKIANIYVVNVIDLNFIPKQLKKVETKNWPLISVYENNGRLDSKIKFGQSSSLIWEIKTRECKLASCSHGRAGGSTHTTAATAYLLKRRPAPSPARNPTTLTQNFALEFMSYINSSNFFFLLTFLDCLFAKFVSSWTIVSLLPLW